MTECSHMLLLRIQTYYPFQISYINYKLKVTVLTSNLSMTMNELGTEGLQGLEGIVLWWWELMWRRCRRQSVVQALALCQDSSITWMIRMDSVQKFFVSTYYYAVHKYISWALFCPADVQYTYVSTVKLKHFVHQQRKVHNTFSPPRCLNLLRLGCLKLFLLAANEYFNSATVINSRSKYHSRPLNLMCCIYILFVCKSFGYSDYATYATGPSAVYLRNM